MINFLEKGHRTGDDKSSAMLYDLYNESVLSSNSDFKKAEEMIEYLSNKDSTAAIARLKIDCFSNRKMNIKDLIFKSCKSVCIWAAEALSNKTDYDDVGTYLAIRKTAYGHKCCPNNDCRKKPSKSNIQKSSQ